MAEVAVTWATVRILGDPKAVVVAMLDADDDFMSRGSNTAFKVVERPDTKDCR
jgi:hypothetical protein